MKKIQLLLIALMLTAGVFGQAIVDNKIIPMSVTLNSILRLNVTTGGNIEFTVNTLYQYQNGISNSDRYDTEFTVASSVDYDVLMYAEDADFIGSDKSSDTAVFELNNIGYTVAYIGTGLTVGSDMDLVGAGVTPSAVTGLTDVAATDIVTSTTGNAGDIQQNKYEINWELGTKANASMNTATLLEQNLAADRYSTNVFLVLEPH